MNWLHLISYFCGGLFLMNAVPHLVNGISGRPFQTPFAKPPGKGRSSSTVNVLWALFNVIVGYFLVFRVGNFAIGSSADALAAFLGAAVIALFLARHFGSLHGGNSP